MQKFKLKMNMRLKEDTWLECCEEDDAELDLVFTVLDAESWDDN